MVVVEGSIPSIEWTAFCIHPDFYLAGAGAISFRLDPNHLAGKAFDIGFIFIWTRKIHRVTLAYLDVLFTEGRHCGVRVRD
jgi:hypothetical protein